MQGSKSCEGRLFYQVTLESLVPQDHLVRRLAKVLDLGWVRPATAAQYSSTGKPSIDPVVISKMMILGFLYNIDSERQLMRDIQVNLAYRWYIGYDLDEAIPNHSVLSKARLRLGREFFERFFEQVLLLCRQAGLINGTNVLIDSTLVKGNASSQSITALKYSPCEYYDQLDSSSAEAPSLQAHGHNIGCKRPRPDRLSDQKHSTTDADATLARKGNTTVLGYKTHISADSAKGIITAVAVTTAAADDTSAVPELLDRHRDVLNSEPRRVVADSIYGSQDCLEHIQNRGIETVIKSRCGGNKYGGLGKEAFVYDCKSDQFICPQGARLRRIRTDKAKKTAHYICDAKLCLNCAQRQKCLGEKSTAKARTVTRLDTVQKSSAQAACSSRIGIELLKLRHTLLEGLFGEAKNFHGLRRAMWRGLEKMLIQSLVIATVLNVKRLVAWLRQRPAAEMACLRDCCDEISHNLTRWAEIFSLFS